MDAIPIELRDANLEAWKKALKNQEIRRFQDKLAILSPQKFRLIQLVLVYDSVQASLRADKFNPIWKRLVKLVGNIQIVCVGMSN